MRWSIVLAAALMLALIMGSLVNGVAAFFVPMETAEGWARADIAAVNSCGLLGLALGSVVMGPVAQRLGIRRISLIATIAMGTAFLAASQVGALWQAYVIFFLAGVFGGGAIFAPLFATVGNWFPSMAGLAIGLAAAGQALGQGGVPLIAAILIEAWGWRGGMAGLGIITLAILLPLVPFMRDAPSVSTTVAAGDAPSVQPSLAVPILSAAVFLCCACMAVPLVHLMPLIQGCGIAAVDAGSVMVAMLTAAILGRVAYGKLCDLIGPVQSWAVASILQTIGVLAFTQFSTLRGFMIFGVIYGFAYSGVMTSLLVSARALTPAARRGALMGIILSFAWLGHAFGGFQGALAFDLTDGYGAGFAIGATAGGLNLILVLLLLHLSKPMPPLRASTAGV